MEKTAAEIPNSGNAGPGFWSWVGLLLPACVWAAQLQSLYLTSDYGCEHYQFGYNHLVSIIALVISVAGGLISWREYSHSAGSEDPAKGFRSRRFIALVGMGLSVLFTALIFAQWLPTLIGVPCGK